MSKSTLFAVIVLFGLCSFTAVATLSKQLELQLNYNIFKDWSSQFNKQYGIEEMAIRFMNWKENFDMVQAHNSQDLPFKLAMNDFADMPSDEFAALHLGLDVSLLATSKNIVDDDDNDSDQNLTSTIENNTTEPVDNLTSLALPKSVDWRKSGKVTGVKNQGQCGGCWAFAASGALEGLYAIKNNKLVTFSDQQMIDCSSSYGNNGCNGGLMTNAFRFTRKYGVELDSGYRYKASEGNCNKNAKKVVFKNTGHREVQANNPLALKQAVARQPVSVGIGASSQAVQLFKSGIITSGCPKDLDHGVLIVGYDVAKNGQEYWIVKNSWGSGWGQNGYMNIAIGSQNGGAGLCGINSMASYPTL
jgi:KDEL-tailed cysteine endopeptidase